MITLDEARLFYNLSKTTPFLDPKEENESFLSSKKGKTAFIVKIP